VLLVLVGGRLLGVLFPWNLSQRGGVPDPMACAASPVLDANICAWWLVSLPRTVELDHPPGVIELCWVSAGVDPLLPQGMPLDIAPWHVAWRALDRLVDLPELNLIPRSTHRAINRDRAVMFDNGTCHHQAGEVCVAHCQHLLAATTSHRLCRGQ
jgi:hypothetical protein